MRAFLHRYAAVIGVIATACLACVFLSRDGPADRDDGKARLLARLAVVRDTLRRADQRQQHRIDSVAMVSLKRDVRYVTTRRAALESVQSLPPVGIAGDTVEIGDQKFPALPEVAALVWQQHETIGKLTTAMLAADSALQSKAALIIAKDSQITTLRSVAATSDSAVSVLQVKEKPGFLAALKSDLRTVARFGLAVGAGYIAGRFL